MRTRHLAALCLSAALLLTGCGAMLKADEGEWCRQNPERVVAASYTIGSPMLAAEVQAEAAAETPSAEYVLACRSAYQNRQQ